MGVLQYRYAVNRLRCNTHQTHRRVTDITPNGIVHVGLLHGLDGYYNFAVLETLHLNVLFEVYLVQKFRVVVIGEPQTFFQMAPE